MPARRWSPAGRWSSRRSRSWISRSCAFPQQIPPRTAWRYLRREQTAIHPFAIHNATRCTRLVRIQGRRIEVQYRYESWVQIPSRRPAMRVDLAPFCRWLNRRERNGTWIWEDTLDLAPRLRMKVVRRRRYRRQLFLHDLRRQLRVQPPVWDPVPLAAAPRHVLTGTASDAHKSRMRNESLPSARVLLWLALFFGVLIWSAIQPKDYLTWLLEVCAGTDRYRGSRRHTRVLSR